MSLVVSNVVYAKPTFVYWSRELPEDFVITYFKIKGNFSDARGILFV